MAANFPDDTTLTVSELNRQARKLLERGFAPLWIEGEISNLARPASGHLYFSLKDADAQVRCAWFRQRQRSRGDGLANGEQMLVFGRVSLYEPRGDYQVIVDRVEPVGEGVLRRRFEQLKKKLATEGLFDSERKRELPALPRQVGVITSPSGAAIRDVLTVLRRRFPAVPVVVYPSAVQGQLAAAELVRALSRAAARRECDVLIIGRGGGSLEDLMAFNDETVARAIHASPIPVISAVGHEVDVTIADFVADWRAPTPSGAAEIAVPEQAEWQRSVSQAARRLRQSMRRLTDDLGQTLDWLARQLASASPVKRLSQQKVRLVGLRRALAAAARHELLVRRRDVDGLAARLRANSPHVKMQRLAFEFAALQRRLPAAAKATLARKRQRLDLTGRALRAVSPLATLERGYAVVTDNATGTLIADASSVTPGTEVRARLARGRLIANIVRSEPDDDA